MVTKHDLFDRLKGLGLPLLETEDQSDANRTLADVVATHDLRLWEGFPVILATSALRGLFDLKKTSHFLKDPHDRTVLEALVALSLALYRTDRAQSSWADALYVSMSPAMKKLCARYAVALGKGGDLTVGTLTLSTARLKTTFGTYKQRQHVNFNELLAAKEELGLEYALSQVFSPKQKELFLKKLTGEKMTKTEAEYFSRAVKKKALALANADLHRLARKLLE